MAFPLKLFYRLISEITDISVQVIHIYTIKMQNYFFFLIKFILLG